MDVYTSLVTPLRNMVSGNEGRSFFKVVVDVYSRRVVGMHAVGGDSPEFIQVCSRPPRLRPRHRGLHS